MVPTRRAALGRSPPSTHLSLPYSCLSPKPLLVLLLALARPCALGLTASPVSLSVINASTFAVRPGAPSQLRWALSGAACSSAPPFAFAVSDYWGQPASPPRLTGTCLDAATVAVEVTLPAGYYELRLQPGPDSPSAPASPTPQQQAFGVISVPATPGGAKPDAFWGILAGFSQIPNSAPAARRRELLQLLARLSIGHTRDFPNWSLLQPAGPTAYNWSEAEAQDALHALYRETGVRALDCFVGAPRWAHAPATGNRSWDPFPTQTMGDAARGLAGILARWADTQAGIEVWNEVDASVPLPADQYAVVLRLYWWAMRRVANVSTALVGGVFTNSVHSLYLETLERNGALALADAWSYHLYDSPGGVGDSVGRFQLWLAGSSAPPGTPLLVTESGAPFSDRWHANTTAGPSRPATAGEGARYAFDIVAHQIENRANGVAQTFAFNFVWYSEGDSNYGLLGRGFTPLRGLAGYAVAAQLLYNKVYVGDLPNRVGALGRGRVFANADGSGLLAVLYPGRAPANFTGPQPLTWTWYTPITEVLGIDGRALSFHCSRPAGCQLECPDALCYARLASPAAAALVHPTVASHLTHLAGGRRGVGQAGGGRGGVGVAAVPVILQFGYDPATTTVNRGDAAVGSALAYMLSPGNASAFVYRAIAHNLRDAAQPPLSAQATLTLPDGTELRLGRVALVSGATELAWPPINLATHAFSPGGAVSWLTANLTLVGGQSGSAWVSSPFQLEF